MPYVLASSIKQLQSFPKVLLGHYPTPLEAMPNLSEPYNNTHLWVKRDDCTGLGLGGNKVRQLEFYLGDALAMGCDTVLSTGAVHPHCLLIRINWRRSQPNYGAG